MSSSRQRVLAVIPARGGSKGLPRKNVLPLAGRPLIAWTIEAARTCTSLDRVVLSSDDEEIIDVAESFGCEVPFRRPAELATDETTAHEVIEHALDALEAEQHGFTHVVLLQPTSPLRISTDIDDSVARCIDEGASACVSVVPYEKSMAWFMQLDEAGRMKPLVPGMERLTRRQQSAAAYTLNGAVYVGRMDVVRRTRSFVGDDTVAHVMPPERSIDIDTEHDLVVAEAIMARRRHGSL